MTAQPCSSRSLHTRSQSTASRRSPIFFICIPARRCVLSNTFDVDRRQLLTRLDKAWQEFRQSYAGLSDSQMLEPGVTGGWSVKDILAHVTAWEEEALKNLPLILKSERPPPYSTTYGGIHAF
ncbi:MAG: maleylpyruvate isomerase N-terminal domain-containing protein, partial [Bryobacteraceae bacterium]|nr:maleylpyruvate isomerase N-terminal domain-containing protein [Bryobacteraceae bacterium]